MSPSPKCGATAKTTGRPCQRVAGEGTDHRGYGRCRFHGGASPSGRTHGKRLMAEQAVATYGLPREVDPHDALTEELYRTAGHVAWLADLISLLPEGELTLKQYGSAVERDDDGGVLRALVAERPAVWLELYQRERRHLVEVGKTCISIGVQERRVRLAERQGELIAVVIRGVLSDLGVLDRPEAPAIVRRHLMLAAAPVVDDDDDGAS